MMDPGSICILTSGLLELVLAIPSNTYIVIANLEIRKTGKLSPSDVIFMIKGIVNILLQGFITLQGILFTCSQEVFYIREVYLFMNSSNCFLMYFSFWLTVWLSAHYCTSITNLSYGFFIWIKRIVSNFLSQILFLTAVGIFPVSVLSIWSLIAGVRLRSSENSTGTPINNIILPCFIPAIILGSILPFCLSLLCLLLTSSFLVRHVWRVKNNDIGSSRPNLQALVTALRTIFFLLLTITSFSISQMITYVIRTKNSDARVVTWIVVTLIPLIEAAIIFQASNKLRRILLRRFWSKSWRNEEA